MIEALNYFYGNNLSANVWDSKYAMKDAVGKHLEQNPDQMHNREAVEFARIEENYGGKNKLSKDYIHTLFRNFSQVIPQGSVMAILGNPHQIGSLSNCIVLPEIFDSYGGIMYADQQL